jgi:hypothetical protein
VGGQRHASAAFTPGKDPLPIVQEAGWAPGPVWTGEESVALTGIPSPDRPARSESLYRLSYADPLKESGATFKGVQFVLRHRKLIVSLNEKIKMVIRMSVSGNCNQLCAVTLVLLKFSCLVSFSDHI